MNLQASYFDHNATSPLHPSVKQAVVDAFQHHWANPHAQYGGARAAAVVIEQVRRSVAARVGADSSQVVFTSGATESNGWVLSRVAGDGPVLVSAVEHPSVREYGTDILPVGRDGVVQLDALAQRLASGPVRVVSVMGANNETGVLQPVVEIANLCRAHGVPFHCDASQMPGRVSLTSLEAPDFVTLSGHKMGGPRGVGVLVARQPLESWLQGGPQERGMRGGTVNTPGVVGFGRALELATEQDSRQRDTLEALCIDLGADILGLGAPRLPNTVCALFDVPGDVLVMALDLEGFAVSTGSACSSGAHKQSAVVQAMGRSGAPVRFSLGADSDISQLMVRLPEVLARVRTAF